MPVVYDVENDELREATQKDVDAMADVIRRYWLFIDEARDKWRAEVIDAMLSANRSST